VDGEFWHGHDWLNKKPRLKTNRDFWIPKIERNIQRDCQNNQLLKDAGWCVIRIWENELKKDFESCVNQIVSYLRDDNPLP
jgi:DNA mismatch endonuclease (patch repair protein)